MSRYRWEGCDEQLQPQLLGCVVLIDLPLGVGVTDAEQKLSNVADILSLVLLGADTVVPSLVTPLVVVPLAGRNQLCPHPITMSLWGPGDRHLVTGLRERSNGMEHPRFTSSDVHSLGAGALTPGEVEDEEVSRELHVTCVERADIP